MNLFGDDLVQPTRQQKTKASRKATAELTKWAIGFLNDSLQFKAHRSNNIPSPIIKREKASFEAFDAEGNAITFEYEKVDIMFKKHNVKEKILDISAVVLQYNGNDKWAGKHLECEVKTGTDSLSEGQAERIKLIKKAGGISFVFDNQETFLFQIRPYMVDKKLAF